MLEKEVGEFSDELHICTDDGSKGTKGFVSNILQNIIDSGKKIDIVWAIGPVIMMKVVADLTKKYNLKTMVSLNPIMVDGTGMCGGCRVTVGGQIKFACVDGPEFDGHKVDYDNLMLRNRRFLAHRNLPKVSRESRKKRSSETFASRNLTDHAAQFRQATPTLL